MQYMSKLLQCAYLQQRNERVSEGGTADTEGEDFRVLDKLVYCASFVPLV